MVETIIDFFKNQGGNPAFMYPKLFTALFALVGIGAMLYGLYLSIRENQVTKWPVAVGVVESLKENSFLSGNKRTHNRTKSYFADITFRFQVNGKTFQSGKFSRGNRVFSDYDEFKGTIVDKYAVGTKIEVHYNPRNPLDCVVDSSEVSYSGYYFFGFVAFVLGIAFCLTLALPQALRPLPTVYAFSIICCMIIVKFIFPQFKIDAKHPGWTNVKGTLMSTEIKNKLPPGEEATPEDDVFYLVGHYEYMYNDNFFSCPVEIGVTYTKDQIDERQKKYTPGLKTDILVNPENPAESTGNNRGIGFLIGLTIFLGCFGIVVPMIVSPKLMDAYRAEQRIPLENKYNNAVKIWGMLYKPNRNELSYTVPPHYQVSTQFTDDIFALENESLSSIAYAIASSIQRDHADSVGSSTVKIPWEEIQSLAERITLNLEINYKAFQADSVNKKQ